jgi:hypothetical protein
MHDVGSGRGAGIHVPMVSPTILDSLPHCVMRLPPLVALATACSFGQPDSDRPSERIRENDSLKHQRLRNRLSLGKAHEASSSSAA